MVALKPFKRFSIIGLAQTPGESHGVNERRKRQTHPQSKNG
jgi:hypothetical protein